ncbi:MAG: hypothetical protein ACI906_004782 [Candidatus Latescibacterota bacterium]|jgi:hypothetical protein
MSSALFLPVSLLLFVALSLYSPSSLILSGEEAQLLLRILEPLTLQLYNGYSPLYLVLMDAWLWGGEHALWLRLPGILCGLVSLVIAVRVLRGLAGAHAGPGALLLLGTAPFLIAQARAISPGMLALMMVLLSYALFLEYLRSGSLPALGAWIFVALLSLGVQAGLVFLVLVQCCIMLVYRERYAQRQGAWWAAQFLVLGLFALGFWKPLSHFFGVRLLQVTPDQAGQALPIFALLCTNLPPLQAIAGTLLFLVLVISGLYVCADWRKDARHGLLILGLLAPCPFYLFTPQSEALLLSALPCLCALVAMGMRLYPRWARQGLWVAIAASYMWSYWHLY